MFLKKKKKKKKQKTKKGVKRTSTRDLLFSKTNRKPLGQMQLFGSSSESFNPMKICS
jgi:hypothetical protein